MKRTNIDALLSNESEEWYTPPVYIEAARKVMGKIDLDPASCAKANRTVKATRYYSPERGENGLMLPWPGRLWINPPYCKISGKSNQEIWSSRLISQYVAGITTEAILLVNASTETVWFQRLLQHYPVCLTDHRISFQRGTDGDNSGPTRGNAFFYLGPHYKRFTEAFKQFGYVNLNASGMPLALINLDLWSEENHDMCICGAVLPAAPGGRGRPAQFCSERCANRARKQRQRERETQHNNVTEIKQCHGKSA